MPDSGAKVLPMLPVFCFASCVSTATLLSPEGQLHCLDGISFLSVTLSPRIFFTPAALQVSMGIKIDNIPDIKAYLHNSASQTLPHKHIIASRITAEHAEEVGSGRKANARRRHALVLTAGERSGGCPWCAACDPPCLCTSP